MKNTELPKWYQILDVIRMKLCRDYLEPTPFTADQVAEEAKIPPAPKSTFPKEKEKKEVAPKNPEETRGRKPLSPEEKKPLSEEWSPKQIASGYLSSLYRWGYIKRHGSIPHEGPGKPTATYVTTKKGQEFRLGESLSDFDILYDAACELREVMDDKKKEAAALQALFNALGEVEQRIKDRAEKREKPHLEA